MSLTAVDHPAGLPATPRPRGLLDGMLHALQSSFQNTTPVAQTRVVHVWWLLGLIAAGSALRFWGLGSVGLHGDEETMAMAARHILVDGRPILPSGMFYPRGLTQLYLMAFSVQLFGESEWAWRLPSVLCGIALIPLTYFAGRRYLQPHWNLAFVAAVAFLPMLIVDSQTARMYIFLVALVTAALVCLHAWERTNKIAWLAGGVAALVLGLDMHALAVGAALLFLVPGLVRGELQKLVLGACATAAVVLAFFFIHNWVQAQYPTPSPEFAAAVGPAPPQGSSVPREFELAFDVALWITGIAAAAFALRTCRVLDRQGPRIAVAASFALGIVLQLTLQYHLAALAYAAGIVIALRYGDARTLPGLAALLIAAGLLLVLHAVLLAPLAGTFTRLVGALVGAISVWPYVRIGEMSPLAAIVTGALLVWGLYQLARGRVLPDFWVLALLGVWAPVFALGAFAWNVPPRYTEMSLIPMLLCAFAACQWVVGASIERFVRLRSRMGSSVAAAAIAVLVVNPMALAATANAGYAIHPDHVGAAAFMRAYGVRDDDIVLAEDVLQQTYYLGSVDYWLIGPDVARRFVKTTPDGVRDFYTGTPVIATPAMLDELLQENRDKRIFVIGSGEDQQSGRRSVRGELLHEAIESDRFEVIYVGRDGLTKVLRAVPRTAPLSRATKEQSRADEAALVESVEAAEQAHGEEEASLRSEPSTE